MAMTPSERQIKQELSDAGIQYQSVSSTIQDNGSVLVTVQIDGRNASGTVSLFSGAIKEHENFNTPILEAFESRLLLEP